MCDRDSMTDVVLGYWGSDLGFKDGSGGSTSFRYIFGDGGFFGL